MVIYSCQEQLESIFTAVYDAWASGYGHENVKIEVSCNQTFTLFCEYVWVEADTEKAEKVARSIKNKISMEAYQMVYRTAMSAVSDRADIIYRFLIQGFRYGKSVLSRLSDGSVMRLFEVDRQMGNEAEHYKQFLRFKQLKNDMMFASIAPKSQVLTLIADHFAERFPSISFVIYDEIHREAVFHPVDAAWFLASPSGEQWENLLREGDCEEEYEFLWRNFFKTIGIKERKNARCQMNFLPLYYRRNMTEFQ